MPDLAVTHVIKSLENKDEFNFKNVVFFQPTSALRRHGDVDKAIEIFKKEKLDSLFSSADMHVTIWRKFGKKVKAISYNYKKRTRRQDSFLNSMWKMDLFILPKKRFIRKLITD